jgi:hypothetical protein
VDDIFDDEANHSLVEDMAVGSEWWLELRTISGEIEDVPIHNKLRTLLVYDGKHLVIFGEGNFTFTVALAAARRYAHFERLGNHFYGQLTLPEAVKQAGLMASWHGLTSTRFEDQIQKDVPIFEEVIQLNKLSIHESFNNVDQICTDMFYDIVCVPPPISPWLYGIDATTTGDLNLTAKDVVWFQCPWTYPIGKIPSLLQGFMRNMTQDEGGILLIGIINDVNYIDAYGLDVLGVFDGRGFSGYEFIGVDNELIDELLVNYGYRYEGMEGIEDVDGIVDVHKELRDCHVTLVFEKADQGSIPSISELIGNPDYFLKKYK